MEPNLINKVNKPSNNKLLILWEVIICIWDQECKLLQVAKWELTITKLKDKEVHKPTEVELTSKEVWDSITIINLSHNNQETLLTTKTKIEYLNNNNHNYNKVNLNNLNLITTPNNHNNNKLYLLLLNNKHNKDKNLLN